jgi:hypothetical protein
VQFRSSLEMPASGIGRNTLDRKEERRFLSGIHAGVSTACVG